MGIVTLSSQESYVSIRYDELQLWLDTKHLLLKRFLRLVNMWFRHKELFVSILWYVEMILLPIENLNCNGLKISESYNIWNNFQYVLFIQSNRIKKNRDRSKFPWLALLFKHLLKLKFGPISVIKKRNDKESMLCLTPKPDQSFFVCPIQIKEKKFFFYKKRAF